MLQLKNIRKSYDSKVILDSISLDINDSEIVSILGPSGSGKTTLLNAILGLTEIDGGQIIFDGKDLTNVPMKDRGFNIVFQDYALNVSEQIPIYSVVNTLIAATDVDKVEISIEGNKEVTFGQNMQLYKFYEWNDSLLASTKAKKEQN